MCHHHCPTELAAHGAMLLCGWYSWPVSVHHTCHEYRKFCDMEIMPMKTHR